MSGERVPPSLDRLVSVPTRLRPPAAPAADLEGTDLEGAPTRIAMQAGGRWTLLFFLSSGCDGCRPLWAAWADPAAAGLGSNALGSDGLAVVAVTKDGSSEDIDELRALAGAGTALVMSSAAWAAYRVHGPPFYVAVDGATGRVATEGVVWSPAQVVADLVRARRHQ